MPLNAHHELAKAIVARWQATSAINTIRGPYRHQAPPADSRSLPYCVFGTYLDRAEIISTTAQSEMRKHTFDFRIYDQSPELCGQHAERFRSFLSTFMTPATVTLPAGLSFMMARPGVDRTAASVARNEHFAEVVVEFGTSQVRS